MITAFYAAVLALLFIRLSLYTIKARRQYKVPLGDGAEYPLQRRIRAQANFAEYTPLFLIMLFLAEYQELPAYGVHTLGIFFLTGRLFHAYGFLFAERYEEGKLLHTRYRVIGMRFTFGAIAISAATLLMQLGLSYAGDLT